MHQASGGDEPVPHQRPFWELLLAYVCLVLSNSVLYSGPVYRAAAATAMGWSQEVVTGAFALGFLLVIPVPFLAGWAADRWGARLVVAGGTLLAGLGLLGAAAIDTLWQWYVTAGGLLSIGCSSVFNGASLLAATRQRRGSVLGINASATGLGLTLGAPLMQVLLQAYGWRATLGYAGLTLTLLALVVSLGVRQSWHRSAEPFSPPGAWSPLPPAPDQRLRLAGFFVGYVLVAFYDESVYQHVYAYGRSLGLSDLAAASIVSATSSAYIAGGVTGGILSDVLGRRVVLVAAAAGSAAALIGLAYSAAHLVWGWAAAFGFTLGASLVVRFATFTDLFAGPWLGRAVGVVAPGYWIGAALATAGGATWIEAGGSFRRLYLGAAVAALLWTLLSVVLTRVPPSSLLRQRHRCRSSR
jgi:MFS family permease